MRKLSFIATLVALFILATPLCKTYAQDTKGKKEVHVGKFEAGKALTKDQVKFLSLVNGNNRGAAKYKAGQKISAADAKTIGTTIGNYSGGKKADKSRGASDYCSCGVCYIIYGDYIYYYCCSC